MPFISEYVDSARYEEICTAPVRKYGEIYIPTRWAVDIEAKAFLGNYDFDRERRSWRYVFWWRGAYFTFGVELVEQANLADGVSADRICRFVSPINLPAQMTGHAEEVRTKVEEALTEYASFPFGSVKFIFENWEAV